ncbi:hypothetical protein [Micromonospora tarensis]|uniref:Small CPxCG-related zinc finger protein n=1 Tax=Micromonospora tarensis TaxID=2806100 RepID=A0ABS1YDK8_9ACTN|nr:hypothetical protein [Micromonospora tarensis]MBM0275339.1 hypothetical protein [Micromonospora tarensis]
MDDLTEAERQTADELLARAACAHPDRVDISTAADSDRVLLCPACGDQWREERPA